MKYTTLLLFPLLGVGCVDAKGSFDHFGDRIVDADTRSIDAPIVSDLPDVTGEWYTVARPDLPQDRFFSFRSTFTFRALSVNTGELDWSAIALDATTMAPVGDPFVANNVPVGMDGVADIPMVGTLDGAANSVSGSTIHVDAFVHATLISTDWMCGTLSGDAGGFPLAGTTFGAVRITGASLPAPIHRCEDGPPPP